MSPTRSSSPDCCARNGTSGRKARWSGASAEPICRNAGRWKRFPMRASPASIASRSAPSPNSTSSPSTRIWCWSGPTGVGKTGLACGLLLKALQNGHRCQFIRAQDLFDEMYASLADRSTRQLLNRLARLDVLLIDEFGYLNLKPEQSNTFFKLMEERYHRHSTIITTNLVYDEWQNFLGNKSMVDALLSRVRHYCHTVTINGPSLARSARLRSSWKRTKSAGRICPEGPLEPTVALRERAGTVRRPDRLLAAQLHERGVPLEAVENALVLAAARRLIRPPDSPPLGTIRSLAYFSPVIEEVLSYASARLLPVSAPQDPTLHPNRPLTLPARRPPTNRHASGGDDVKSPRTPAAWMIMLVH